MPNALQTALWLVTRFFAPRHNAQIRFLKAQIAILRKRVRASHIVPSPEEKAELLRLSFEFARTARSSGRFVHRPGLAGFL